MGRLRRLWEKLATPSPQRTANKNNIRPDDGQEDMRDGRQAMDADYIEPPWRNSPQPREITDMGTAAPPERPHDPMVSCFGATSLDDRQSG